MTVTERMHADPALHVLSRVPYIRSARVCPDENLEIEWGNGVHWLAVGAVTARRGRCPYRRRSDLLKYLGWSAS